VALPVFDHPLIGTWTLTLGEVHQVLETVGVRGCRLLGVHLLTGQRLLELHLLLHLLLLVCQDGVLALL